MKRARRCLAAVLFFSGLAIELVGTALEILAGLIEPHDGA